MTIVKLQDYTSKPIIEGVKIFTPTLYKDDGGEFCEILRAESNDHFSNGNGIIDIIGCDDDGKGSQLQYNYSLIHPGVIKGFHIHKKQTDIWFAPNKILVNLIDFRNIDAATISQICQFPKDFHFRSKLKQAPSMRLVLDKQRLVIPSGVAHGLSNPYNEDRILLYVVDQFFNPADEWRLPWDIAGEDIWRLSRE